MKVLFGILFLVSVASLLCISLIPRNVTREQVAEELDRILVGEDLIEKKVTPGDWTASTKSDPEAFGATVLRSGAHLRIDFDQTKLRFQNHAVPEESPTPSPK